MNRKEAMKKRMIAIGLDVWMMWLRLARALRRFGRPRLRAVDHVTLPVQNLDESRRFYCDVLGATLFMTIDDEALRRFGRPSAGDGDGVHHHSLLVGGSTRVDIFQQRNGQPPALVGHPHLAFRVPPGEMLWWKTRLESAGVPTEGPLQLGPPGQASLYFNDPSGNHLEISCLGFTRAIPIGAPQMARLAWSSQSITASGNAP
jgi:catechol 2,3-dioxygenase-like lactoylglutathione lyase family enzyme